MPRNPDDEFASADERAEALDPNVGSGTPQTAPWEEDPTVGLLRRNPVVLLALVLLLPSAGAAATAWAQGQTVVAIVTTSIVALIATLTPIVRAAVTPVVAPRLDAETPLVVAGPQLARRSTLPS